MPDPRSRSSSVLRIGSANAHRAQQPPGRGTRLAEDGSGWRGAPEEARERPTPPPPFPQPNRAGPSRIPVPVPSPHRLSLSSLGGQHAAELDMVRRSPWSYARTRDAHGRAGNRVLRWPLSRRGVMDSGREEVPPESGTRPFGSPESALSPCTSSHSRTLPRQASSPTLGIPRPATDNSSEDEYPPQSPQPSQL
ncbi:hypothetical protein JHW43_001372 [Diplocarpon mali]|nr:hypothetical protein JHW43_001372 [Diplocarpon mali]